MTKRTNNTTAQRKRTKGQTIQQTKEKGQKDKQRSVNNTHKTKDRVTWTPLKTGCELRCSGRAGSSCPTSGTRRLNLVTNSVHVPPLYCTEQTLRTKTTNNYKCIILIKINLQYYNSSHCWRTILTCLDFHQIWMSAWNYRLTTTILLVTILILCMHALHDICHLRQLLFLIDNKLTL